MVDNGCKYYFYHLKYVCKDDGFCEEWFLSKASVTAMMVGDASVGENQGHSL